MSRITADTKVRDLPFVGAARISKEAVSESPEQAVGRMIAEFKEQVNLGTAAWARAGIIVAAIFGRDPEAMPRIVKEAGLAPATVRLFQRIGEGTLLPQLLPATKRVRALPLADQKRVAAGTLPCVVMRGDTPDVRRVDVMSAAPEVLDVMIGPGGLRTEAEQLAFIKASARRRTAVPPELPRALWEAVPLGIRVTRIGVITVPVLFSMLKALNVKVKRVR